MASESQLGEAFVPIRATLDKLDGDLAQARNKVGGAVKIMENASGKAGGVFKALNMQFDNLKKQVPALGSAFNLLTNPITLVTAGVGAFGLEAKKSITELVAYNKTVREMMQVTGLSADETSRIIQVSDDWGIELGTVTNALDLMNRKGITPSIDKLSQIADEYVNATDKSAFMEEATKKYGRSFGDLIPILAKGGDALREQAASISDNMIATDESIEASREFEVAMDDLGDAVQGLEYTLGNDLIPILVDTIQTLMGTYDASKHAEDGISGLDKAFGGLNAGISGLKQATNILVFIGDLTWSLWHGGLSPKRMEELRQKYFGVAGAIDAIKDNADGIPKTFDIAATSIYGVATAAGILDDELRTAENNLLIEQYATQMKDAATQAEILATAQETAIKQLSRLNEYINGTLGPNEEKFTETQGDLNTKMGEIQGEINKAINDGYKPLGEKVLELKGTYADLKKQYDENASAHEEDTKRIILGILAQEMAAMGFSDSTAFAKIAMKWGLIDEATMNAMMATDKAINWLRNHPGDYAGFEAMMNGVVTDVGGVTTAADNAALALDKITGQHEVGINVTVTGDAIPNIPGGVWNKGEPYIGAATGFEGMVRKPTWFLAGEDENEYVNITPIADAMSDLSNYKLPMMELKGVDNFGGAGMAMFDHKNQLPPAANPLTINLYAVPEKEKDMRRQARYIAEEFERRNT